MLDDDLLQNFLESHLPSAAVGSGDENSTPTVFSTVWNTEKSIKSLFYHQKRRQINSEFRLAIEKISQKTEISLHDLPKRINDVDHDYIRQIRSDFLDDIANIALRYNCVGGRWMTVRQTGAKISDSGSNFEIDRFWRDIVLSQLKANKCDFDSVTVTGKLDQSWTQRKGKKEADTRKSLI